MSTTFWIIIIVIIYASDSLANAIPDSKDGPLGIVRRVLRFISMKPRNKR